MPELLQQVFGFICGQDPAHTWAPGGTPLPLCQRCTGLYVGVAVAALLHWRLRPKLTGHFLEVHGAFLLLMLPFGFHWLPQGALLRTMTGVLFGFGIVTFLWLPVAWGRFDFVDDFSRIKSLLSYSLGIIMTLVLLPLTAMLGGILAACLITCAVACGVIALVVLVFANAVLATLSAGKISRFKPPCNTPNGSPGAHSHSINLCQLRRISPFASLPSVKKPYFSASRFAGCLGRGFLPQSWHE